LFFFLSAINLHFFFGVFLHFIIGANTQKRPSVSFGHPGKEHGLFGFLGIVSTSLAAESLRRIPILP
ncbi:hypothetical protein AALB53_25295, partial [Lachnospiraceae bacterium 47-T17]